ncbi:MAG: hypothetical protein CSA81_00705 [Acidobacteria bacterium]|nr:MAG: hypothetical protein CSA81_00705 [Acidobacteriota bacterium]
MNENNPQNKAEKSGFPAFFIHVSTYLKQSIRFDLRLWLAIYFILISTVIINHLSPLPEQKPIIEFSGFLAVTLCLSFAISAILAPMRWVLFTLIGIIPLIAWFFLEKIAFYQMALEDSFTLNWAPYTLLFIVPVIFVPQAHRCFSHKIRKGSPGQMRKKGFPF